LLVISNEFSEEKKPRPKADICRHCAKVVWHKRESVEAKIGRMKSTPGMRKPYLLGSYKCPEGLGWHVGRDYKLQWISLCIGEHK
jgi:hypothetical protein